MDALMQTLSQQYGQDGVLTIPTEKLAELLTSHTPNKKTRQKRPARDPNRPKRPQSAFFLWSADNRDRVRQNWMTTQTLRQMKNRLPLELILKVLRFVEFKIVLPSVAGQTEYKHQRGYNYDPFILQLGIDCWEDITIGMTWSLPCVLENDEVVLQTYEIEGVSKKSLKVKETHLAICSCENTSWSFPYHTALDYTPTPKISHKTIKYAKEGARNDWTGLGTNRHADKGLGLGSGEIAFGGHYKHPKGSFADLFSNEDYLPEGHSHICADYDPNFKMTLDEQMNWCRRHPARLPTKTITLVNPF